MYRRPTSFCPQKANYREESVVVELEAKVVVESDISFKKTFCLMNERNIAFAGDVATDAVPLLSRRNSQEPTCCNGRQLQGQRQTPFSRSRTFPAQGPCLHVWSGGA